MIPVATSEDFRELAEWIASLGESGEKHLPGQHDQETHGRRGGSGDEPSPFRVGGDWEPSDIPRTENGVIRTFITGYDTFRTQLVRHDNGQDFPDDWRVVASAQGIDQAAPELVTDDQRARCVLAAQEFMNDPRMQPLFEQYGRPEVVIAGRVCARDPQYAGADPALVGVLAQWSYGTMILYGPSAGEPTTSADPGWNIAGTDPVGALTHEYGHQIMNVIGHDSDGLESDTRIAFKTALMGVTFEEWDSGTFSEDDAATSVEMNAGQFSEYAVQGGPDEAFSEAFELIMQPGFDIEDYDGGARDALQVIIDRLRADIPEWQQIPGQQRLPLKRRER